MSLQWTSFKQGVAKTFELPRLSLPLIGTLGLTLAAVLTVLAMAKVILWEPLPDVKNESELYQVNLTIEFSKDMKIPFLNTPGRLAYANDYFGDDYDWGLIINRNADVDIDNAIYNVVQMSATKGIFNLLGLDVLKGKSGDIDAVESGVWISKKLWDTAFLGESDVTGKTVKVAEKDMPILGVVDTLSSLNGVDPGETSGQVWLLSDPVIEQKQLESLSLTGAGTAFVRLPNGQGNIKEQLETWFLDYVNTIVPEGRPREFFLERGYEAEIKPYRDAFLGDSQLILTILLVATTSLLVMASLNLMNMFIAHYQSRNKEFSIQLFSGASLGRVKLLNFIENLPIFSLAGVVGLLGAAWLLEVVPDIADGNLPMLSRVNVDYWSMFAAMIILIIVNGFFAYGSTIGVDKQSLSSNLNSSGKGTLAQQDQTVSKVLMIAQLTLACVLITAAMTSFNKSYNSVTEDLGYQVKNAYEVQMRVLDDEWQSSLFDYEKYQSSELYNLRQKFNQRLTEYGQVIDTQYLPLSGNLFMQRFVKPDQNIDVLYLASNWAEGYFEAFDIDLLAGRNLTPEDLDTQNVVISRQFAQALVGEVDWKTVLGQEYLLVGGSEKFYKVVGVVEGTKPAPGSFGYTQFFTAYFYHGFNSGPLSSVLVLPEGEEITVEQAQQALNDLDPRLGEIVVNSMSDRLDAMNQAEMLNMYIVLVMAFLTLILAGIGVAGLSQMSAAQKRYELAVRQATGASQQRLLSILFKEASLTMLVGLSLGIIASIFGYQYLVSILESAPEFDWPVTLMTNATLAIVMMISIAVPSWKVISNDPMQALREL